jgi:hypothetical protein
MNAPGSEQKPQRNADCAYLYATPLAMLPTGVSVTLLDQIDQLWTPERAQLSCGWATQLAGKMEVARKAANKFHEWSPLRVYLSYTRAIRPQISFSLRYQGQEVASLDVGEGKVQIRISRKQAKKNGRYFGEDKLKELEGTFDWRGDRAAAFRKCFRDLSPDKRGKVAEHRIESEFLGQMADKTSDKFGGTLKGIQPVMLAGCPFQFPVPISGNSGVPKGSRGNIDILARRGVGGSTRLSIWELKSPGVTAHAVEQTYIYAVALMRMLRSPCGQKWYEVLGFKRKLPDKLIIEGVVAVSLKSKKRRASFEDRFRKFRENNPLSIGKDEIKLYVVYYEENPLRIVRSDFPS